MVKPRKVGDVAKEFLLQRELEKQAPSTGFPDLDKCIGGFLPRHLYTLTAQTNAGKTMLACNFADAVRKQGKKVLYIALEPDINISATLAGVRTNKTYSELTDRDILHEDGQIDILLQEDIKSLSHLVEIIKQAGEYYSLIIVDHISYFVTGDNTNQAQSNALKTLASLSKTQNTAILLIAHIKKGVKNDFITMDDISGSGAFKQDSTEVLILVRQVEDENSITPTYKPEGFIYVPKTKVYSKHKSCEILFQDNKAKILGKYYG